MEVRTARLESNVEHLYAQVADLKADLRSLRDRIDRMDARFDTVIETLNSVREHRPR